MKAAVGTVVGLTYDSPREIEVGDIIRTTSGRCYRIEQFRRQERGKHTGRWHIAALVIDPGDVTEDDVVLPLYWYTR